MTPPVSFQVDQVQPGDPLAHDIGLARQFMTADLVTRGDGWKRGVRSVLLQNDLITLEVLVDRALDIYSARIRQLPIGWLSPTGVVAPWFVENTGFGTQRAFFGGLLTTCGLDHIGPAVERSAEQYGYASRPRDQFPMHGRISGSPADLTGYGVVQRGGVLEAFVEGQVAQVSLFGEHLVLHRRISIIYGSALVQISDHVVNEGYASTPLAMLYHVNVGWPIVTPTTEFRLPTANPEQAAPLRAPERGSSERVVRFQAAATENELAVASIYNNRVSADVAAGLTLKWRAADLPTMLRWDVANIGGNYAVGLEPTTLQSGPTDGTSQFPTIEPGETRQLGISLELLHGAAGSLFSGSEAA